MKQLAFSHKDKALVPEAAIKEKTQSLSSYIQFLNDLSRTKKYDVPESFICLPFDDEKEKEIKRKTLALKNEKLKYIILIGIGGSNMGAYAVYAALYPWIDALSERLPKLICLEGPDPKVFAGLTKILDRNVSSLDEIIIFINSKSGATVETVANAEALHKYLKQRFIQSEKQFIFITDSESPLWQVASANHYELITTERYIGGRFSLLSAPHLLPLSLSGLSTSSLLEGARLALNHCLSLDPEENLALTSAAIIHYHLEKGVNIINNFFFAPELETIGKWVKQLVAESLGKNGKSLTPLVSIGPNDLHSMLQLYLSGPKDEFTSFVCVSGGPELNMGKTELTKETLPELSGKSFLTVNDALRESVRDQYQRMGLPISEIILPDISERSLGQFMQFKMMEIIYLAKLMGVNGFDQPSVENYKKEARTRLARAS